MRAMRGFLVLGFKTSIPRINIPKVQKSIWSGDPSAVESWFPAIVQLTMNELVQKMSIGEMESIYQNYPKPWENHLEVGEWRVDPM